MITSYNGRAIALCDGCDIEAIIIKDEASAPFELRRRRWAVNTAQRGWRHFCASCAIEFAFGEGRAYELREWSRQVR